MGNSIDKSGFSFTGPVYDKLGNEILGGGGSSPGGSDGQVQYNDNDSLGGMSAITTSSGSDLGFHGATPSGQINVYSVSNGTTDRTYDANSTTVAELADVLFTLISDLQTKGLIATVQDLLLLETGDYLLLETGDRIIL